MFKVKEFVDINDLKEVHPLLFLILADVLAYAQMHNIEVTITSIKDSVPGRVFQGHAEGRCFDVRSKNWPQANIDELQALINHKYAKIGQISKADGIPRACVYHKIADNEYHFHFGVRPDALVDYLICP